MSAPLVISPPLHHLDGNSIRATVHRDVSGKLTLRPQPRQPASTQASKCLSHPDSSTGGREGPSWSAFHAFYHTRVVSPDLLSNCRTSSLPSAVHTESLKKASQPIQHCHSLRHSATVPWTIVTSQQSFSSSSFSSSACHPEMTICLSSPLDPPPAPPGREGGERVNPLGPTHSFPQRRDIRCANGCSSSSDSQSRTYHPRPPHRHDQNKGDDYWEDYPLPTGGTDEDEEYEGESSEDSFAVPYTCRPSQPISANRTVHNKRHMVGVPSSSTSSTAATTSPEPSFTMDSIWDSRLHRRHCSRGSDRGMSRNRRWTGIDVTTTTIQGASGDGGNVLLSDSSCSENVEAITEEEEDDSEVFPSVYAKSSVASSRREPIVLSGSHQQPRQSNPLISPVPASSIFPSSHLRYSRSSTTKTDSHRRHRTKFYRHPVRDSHHNLNHQQGKHTSSDQTLYPSQALSMHSDHHPTSSSTLPIEKQSSQQPSSHSNNSSYNGTTTSTSGTEIGPSVHMPPLPGRRFQLLKYHLMFLLLFTLSIVVGSLLHHSKLSPIRYSLSIEGFECLLPSRFLSIPSVSCRGHRINLGALLATDLLKLGWGRERSNGSHQHRGENHHQHNEASHEGLIHDDSYSDGQADALDYPLKPMPPSSSCAPFFPLSSNHAEDDLRTLLIHPFALSLLKSESSVCPVHQDLIQRSFCSSALDLLPFKTEWSSSPFSCLETYWLSFSLPPPNWILSSSSSLLEWPEFYQRIAPLIWAWEQVTPSLLLGSCDFSNTNQRCRFRRDKTVRELQRDVYCLASTHPKLVSLRQLFSFYDVGSADPQACSSQPGARQLQPRDKQQPPGRTSSTPQTPIPSGTNETVCKAHQVIDFFHAVNLRLFTIGKSNPSGLMDSSIWFAQSHSIRWLLRRLQQQLAWSRFSSPWSTQSTPQRLTTQLDFYWDVRLGLGGSLGRPVTVPIRDAENQQKGSDPVETVESLKSSPSPLTIQSGSQKRSLLPDWTEAIAKGGEHLLWLFKWSLGILSPCYPLYQLTRWLFTTGAIYGLLLIAWLPSIASPAPVTLVHFSRLVVYLVLILYRYFVLYYAGNKVFVLLVDPGVDYSDNIVLYLLTGLILCMECVAAERSHARVPTHPREKEGGKPTSFQAGEQEEQQKRDANKDGVVERSEALQSGLMSSLRRSLLSDTEDTSVPHEFCEQGQSLTTTTLASNTQSTTNTCFTNIQIFSVFPSQDERVLRWRWPHPVQFVRCYCAVLMALLCYSSFFTALFFHHPSECFIGLGIGVVFLYLPFWLFIISGCVTLDKTFGILRSSRP